MFVGVALANYTRGKRDLSSGTDLKKNAVVSLQYPNRKTVYNSEFDNTSPDASGDGRLRVVAIPRRFIDDQA